MNICRRCRIKTLFRCKSVCFPATVTDDKAAARRGTQLQQDAPSPIPRTVSTAPFLKVRLTDVYQTKSWFWPLDLSTQRWPQLRRSTWTRSRPGAAWPTSMTSLPSTTWTCCTGVLPQVRSEEVKNHSCEGDADDAKATFDLQFAVLTVLSCAGE